MNNSDSTEYHITISKEEVALLPQASFNGFVSVVDSESSLASAIADIKQSSVIGFDTETRPSFKKGKSYNVSLLQLSTHEGCYLFRLNIIGLCRELIDLLEASEPIKVGLSVHDDFLNLSKLSKLNPNGFIDLQKYVKDYMISDNALQRIYAILFGERISKGQRLTNWEADNLSESQIKYAALDAQACLRIYDYLSAGNFQPMQSPYLHEVVAQEEINE